mgnify:FL=1
MPGLKVGAEAVTWYQEELDRFSELAARHRGKDEPGDDAADESPASRPDSARLLEEFTKPFLPA